MGRSEACGERAHRWRGVAPWTSGREMDAGKRVARRMGTDGEEGEREALGMDRWSGVDRVKLREMQ